MKIGITTTIPIEVVYAAGLVPVDLNNIFINSPDPAGLINRAELDGYPRNICGWTKGLYATALQEGIKAMVFVTQGDCSNTQALMETLELRGVEVIPFAFPYDRDPVLLERQIEHLMERLGVVPLDGWPKVRSTMERLDGIRKKVHEIDRLTWQDGLVSGRENHYYQVSCSDFNGEPAAFEAEVDGLLGQLPARRSHENSVRLAYIGVPPIMTDLYDYVESIGARVVFNEVQRQFTMPFDTPSLVERYRLYTYPYTVFKRIADIQTEIERRKIDGVIHYVQSFCFRQIEDLIFRERLGLPVMTLEGDRPEKLDARTRLRLEAFVEMLRK
ncbi:MAG: 2-hydroxyacyl-CoA dehydratase [Dehalococcoidia bacterium]|nr:2-hydroxyacyl-CoA dehydratase [Dehalococcoidia bacterium]